MLDSIIFDMDGLLIDTEIISYQLYSALLVPYGFTVSLHDYAETYSGKTEEKNVITLLEHYPLPLSREECFARISAMEKEFLAKGVALKPGAKELLTYLKEHGYKIALASSSIADRAYGILDQHGIRGCFDAFVFARTCPRAAASPRRISSSLPARSWAPPRRGHWCWKTVRQASRPLTPPAPRSSACPTCTTRPRLTSP